MSDPYYVQGIQQAMRDFISKIIVKYVEHVRENPEFSQSDLENIQDMFKDFENWLYLTLKG